MKVRERKKTIHIETKCIISLLPHAIVRYDKKDIEIEEIHRDQMHLNRKREQEGTKVFFKDPTKGENRF